MWKKKICLSIGLALAGVVLFSFSGIAQMGGTEVTLGTGSRKTIKVDYQRVKFPHKMHQKLVLKMAGGDPEVACKVCHHRKRRGRDPRACRRCHAKRQVKAKGKNLCLTGCHAKKGRTDLIERIKEAPSKGARKGQLLKLKDAFHLRCKNCHAVLRSFSIDLDSTKYMAPILNCEGCHMPVNEADRKAVEHELEAEKKRTGDVFGDIIHFLKTGEEE